MIGNELDVVYENRTPHDGKAPLILNIVHSDRSIMLAFLTLENVVKEIVHISGESSQFAHELPDLALSHCSSSLASVKETFVATRNNRFTLLPEQFAASATGRDTLAFTLGGPNRGAKDHHLSGVLFSAEHTDQPFARIFPGASFRHNGAVMIDLLFTQHSLLRCDVFVYVSDNMTEVAIKKNGSFVFYNFFETKNEEETLYYLMFSLDQLKLDPASVNVGFACDTESPKLTALLGKYIRNLRFCVNDPAIKLEKNFMSLPSHHYFILLHQHLCVL